MACIARTCLLDVVLSNGDDQSIQNLLGILDEQLKTMGLRRSEFCHKLASSTLYVYVSDKEVSASLRIYPEKKLASITIEESNESKPISNDDIEAFRKKLSKLLELRVVRIPHMKRGAPVANYYTSADERILEYDFNEILYDKQSKFQEVKILKSPTMGAVLFLDDLQNLGECDLPYTQGLMDFGEYSYKDKEVLILGGGDGGLLHELLKENPKMVTMIDIDDTVMQSCRKYLRGACGDSLDNYEGENYKVIVGDCLEYMEKYTQEGRKFDVIFSDLTDIPISAELCSLAVQNEQWEFLKKVVHDSLKLLKIKGVFQNHAIGKGCTKALEKYEKFLDTLPNTHFSSRSRFVPSFLEDWVFYSIILDK